MIRFSSHSARNLIGRLIVIGLSILMTVSTGFGQDAAVEQIVVGFEVPRLIEKDIFVQFDGKSVFLPVIDIFAILEYKVEADLESDRISGHLASKSDKFMIDLTRFVIKVPDFEREMLRSDYVYDATGFYLRLDLFGDLFGLQMKFDFSELKVKLPLDEDFPSFQKFKRNKLRQRLNDKKEALRDVTTLSRTKSYAAGGSLDWRLSTNPLRGGTQHYSMDLGGVLLGGDIEVSGSGNTQSGMDFSQSDYRWHYYFDDWNWLKQADIGKIFTTGNLGRSMTGVRLTNQPQVRRKYFQTVHLSGAKEAGWEVELYIDGRLADFQMTDQDGQYDFNLDIFYGATKAELKFYGPNGEMETSEQHFRIPFNLIPSREVEYTVAVGEGQGQDAGRSFAQAGLYYGLLPKLTAGGNIDVPLTPLKNEMMRYSMDATLQLATNLTLSGSYAPNYRAEFDANYIWPSVISVGASATSYAMNEVTNPMHQLHRWQVSLSSPLRIAGRYLGMRFNIAQDQFETFGATNITYGLNTSVKPFHVNYIGQYKISNLALKSTTEMSSKIMGSIQFHRLFRPQFIVDYDHSLNELVKYGVTMSRRLWRSGQISLSYEHNPLAGVNSFLVNIHFFTSFLETSSRAQVADRRVTMSQQHRGSIRFDHNQKRLMFDRRQSVGYGSAVVSPFLDENYNGLKDRDEVAVPGLKAKISGASGRPRGGDRTYYYDRLRPYDEYLVQIDEYSLDDPTLKPSHENFKITLNPSVVTAIDVPIVTASEVGGSVRRQVSDGSTGVGAVRVMLLNISKDVLVEVPTFSDGEFYYLGLLPGSYRAYLDTDQLSRAGFSSEPPFIEFDIRPVIGGEMIENIDFLMVPVSKATDSQ